MRLATSWFVKPDAPSVLLINPHARDGAQAFAWFRQALGTAINLVDARLTPDPDQMAQAIRRGLENGMVRFVIGGGDGTLSGAASLLVDTEAIMGIVPLGTGNTFAAGLDLLCHRQKLVAILARGRVDAFDVGEALRGEDRRVFLNSLTIGVSTRLAQLLTPETKRRHGWLAWPLMIRRALRSTPVFRVVVTAYDGHRGRSVEDSYWTRQIVVANGRTVAGPLAPTPQTSAQDGLLDVFSLGGSSEASLIRLFGRLVTGRLVADREAHFRQVPELILDTEPKIPVDIDGDTWLVPPIRCRIRPSALRVIVPEPSIV